MYKVKLLDGDGPLFEQCERISHFSFVFFFLLKVTVKPNHVQCANLLMTFSFMLFTPIEPNVLSSNLFSKLSGDVSLASLFGVF